MAVHLSQLERYQAMCRLHSDDLLLDSLELMIKGRQMGLADLFEHLVHGAG